MKIVFTLDLGKAQEAKENIGFLSLSSFSNTKGELIEIIIASPIPGNK